MTDCFGQAGESYSECTSKSLVDSTGAITDNLAVAFINDGVAALSGMINMVLAAGVGNAPEDLVKAALAARCAITNGGEQVWKLLMAVFFAMRAFGM